MTKPPDECGTGQVHHVVESVRVPVPPLTRARARHHVYHLSAMEPGDSIFVADIALKKDCHTAIQNYRRRFPALKFALRVMDGGFRVWRLE